MNSRRPTGFDSSVKAVRPSISSAIDTLAVQTASTIERTMMNVRPACWSTLMSSPSVFSGDKGKEDQAENTDRQQQREQRLRHRLLGGHAGDGRDFRR